MWGASGRQQLSQSAESAFQGSRLRITKCEQANQRQSLHPHTSQGGRPTIFSVCAQVWGASGRQQLSQGAESAIEGAKNAATKGPSMGEALQHKSVVISCLLLVFQQLSGINAIVYFSSSVFAKVRWSISSPRMPKASTSVWVS